MPVDKSVLLEIFKEHAMNARHFDTVRVGVSTVLGAFFTVMLTIVLKQEGPREIGPQTYFILFAWLLFGCLCTYTSAFYRWLYFRESYVSRKMQKYCLGSPRHNTPINADYDWVRKKIIQSRREFRMPLKNHAVSAFVLVNVIMGVVTPIAIFIAIYASLY